ncbi:MAG: hypothetical protein KatS3mg087_1594 [Patescibacteria group bacterium]|nr:MAG: hypothetical protein KatS3mg087_1594 [Patescibacteria group bacterium]
MSQVVVQRFNSGIEGLSLDAEMVADAARQAMRALAPQLGVDGNALAQSVQVGNYEYADFLNGQAIQFSMATLGARYGGGYGYFRVEGHNVAFIGDMHGVSGQISAITTMMHYYIAINQLQRETGLNQSEIVALFGDPTKVTKETIVNLRMAAYLTQQFGLDDLEVAKQIVAKCGLTSMKAVDRLVAELRTKRYALPIAALEEVVQIAIGCGLTHNPRAPGVILDRNLAEHFPDYGMLRGTVLQKGSHAVVIYEQEGQLVVEGNEASITVLMPVLNDLRGRVTLYSAQLMPTIQQADADVAVEISVERDQAGKIRCKLSEVDPKFVTSNTSKPGRVAMQQHALEQVVKLPPVVKVGA